MYAELVAVCSLLPGPASSQVGIAVGALRAGRLGAVAAWIGFTLPSAAAVVAFAYAVGSGSDLANAGWVQGLKLVAVAVVAHAVLGMARRLTPDIPRAAIAVAAAAVAFVWAGVPGQIAPIAGGALVGVLALRAAAAPVATDFRWPVGGREGIAALAAFATLLVLLPLARSADGHAVALADAFYRAGSLVFGGGHVVLPLLDAEVVGPGWVTEEEFVTGYGAAQAVPGPLFTFAGYLGAVERPEPNGVAGAAVALVAVFLPSFLLVAGVLPFWGALRGRRRAAAALAGVNAAVVGLLLAALVDPVASSALDGPADVAVALVLLALLVVLRAPPWLVVLLGAAAGAAVSAV